MFKWIYPTLCMLPLVAMVVWLIHAIIVMRRTARHVAKQRARIHCPNCGCSLSSMFDDVDRVAVQQMREVIERADQLGIQVTPAGHPVELNCIGCNCRLSFGMSDIVSLVDQSPPIEDDVVVERDTDSGMIDE